MHASRGGLVVSCEGTSCPDEPTTVKDVAIARCNIGLWAYGAKVRVEGGRIAESRALSLTGGHGVIASHGAALELVGTTVEDNAEVGVLLDGANTTALLDGVTVSKNQGRGAWAQKLSGTEASPRLRITGGTFAANRLVGIGARESSGLLIERTTVRDTVTLEVAVDFSTREHIGDGIGLFAGTAATRIAEARLESNGRAQLLVDEGGQGISVRDSTLAGQLYRAVVQRTSATVDVPSSELSNPGRNLGVSAAPVPLGN